MKMTNDPSVRATYVELAAEPIVDSAEIAPGVVVDYNAAGAIVGLELLDVPAPDAAVLTRWPDARLVYLYVKDMLEPRVQDAAARERLSITLRDALCV